MTEGVPTYISVFAGRIADTGVDPLPLMKESVKVAHSKMVLNYYGQVAVKCSMLSKLMKLALYHVVKKVNNNLGRDINELPVDTVQGFAKDIKSSGLSIL